MQKLKLKKNIQTIGSSYDERFNEAIVIFTFITVYTINLLFDVKYKKL